MSSERVRKLLAEADAYIASRNNLGLTEPPPEEIDDNTESQQGYFGDLVDAFQHGTISGVADTADGVRYLGGVEAAGEAADWMRGQADNQLKQMSPEGREQMQNFGLLGEDNEFSWSGLGLNAASTLGGLLPSLIPGGVATKVLSTAGKVAGATGKAAKTGAAVAGFGAGGGLVGAGSTGNQAYETVANADFNLLAESDVFKQRYWDMRDHQEMGHMEAANAARESIAREIADAAAADGAVLSAITNGAFGPAFGRLFSGTAGGYAKSMATGVATEGTQEFVESGGQRMITNSNIDPVVPTDLMDSAANDALTGALLGGMAGGTFGGAGRAVRGVRGGGDANTADPQGQLQAELERVEQNLKANAGTMSREEYASSVELRDSLLNEINNFDPTSNTVNGNEAVEDALDQTTREPLVNEKSVQTEDAFQSQLNDPAFQARRARELDRRFNDSQPFDMAGPQQLGLQESSTLGLTSPDQTPVAQELAPTNSETVTNSQMSDEGASLNASGLHTEQNQHQADRLQPEHQSYIAKPSKLTEAEIVAPEMQPQQSLGGAAEPVSQQDVTDANEASGEPTLSESIDSAASVTNTSPTQPQIEANNYKKGRVKIHGLNIAIENPKGSTRTGTDKSGKEWTSQIAHYYGDIKGVKGADGDNLDVFIGDTPDSQKVFIVNQIDPSTGKFDEHKVMFGFNSKEEAEQGYLANYEEGWNGIGSIEELTTDGFKNWIKYGNTKSPYSRVRAETPAQQSSIEELSDRVAKSDVEIIEGGKTESQSSDTNPSQEETKSVDIDSPNSDGGFDIERTATNIRVYGNPKEIRQALRSAGVHFPGSEFEGGVSFGHKLEDKIRNALDVNPNLSVGDNTDGMKVDDVRAAVEPLINDLHERGTFEAVQSVNDLPFAIRLQAKAKLKKSKGENPVLRGINAGDKNYLIADGLRSEKEAVEIFLHEVVGHKAVLDMLGKQGDNIMEQIARSYGRKGLQDLIKTYGVEPNTKEGRILLGKEKVAHMAERGEKPALLKRLVAKVKSWLRNYFPSIKWSDNDVLSLISNARDNVENRYMVKVDLDAKTNSAAQEDGVNLSITDRFKKKVEDRGTQDGDQKPDTTFDKMFKSLGQKDKTVFQKFKDEAKRQFKAGGMLPDSVFSEKIKRDSHMNASELEIGAHLSSFRKAVKKAYGKEYKDLPEKVRQELNRQMSSTEVNKLVPFPIRFELMKMRATIKGLSKEYADVLQQDIDDLTASGNDVAAESKAELLQTILNNMDTYAHRSYRAFDNPEWPKKVPEEIVRKATDYIKSRYTDGTDAEKEERAVRAVRSILEEGTAYQDMGSFIKESKLGAKDLSTLKRRKEIAPEIRELLGEYHDVEVNFAKTVSKMSHLVANHKFLKRLYELGTTEGFFFTEENKPLDKSVVKIAADGSDVMAPLNGLYTYPEIERAFREALGKEGDMPLWLSSVIRLNGVVKYSKTVLSPTTAMRNIWSAFFFAVANGHFDISQMRKSLSVRSEYFGGDTKAANLDYLKRLKKLGVIYDTPYAGEMMDLLQDSRIEELMTNKKVFSTFTKLNDFAQKFYQYGDDMWKIMGWENEKAMLMKHKGMSEADAEVAAAERIRNTYPTYSMTGRFTQSLRRFPLAGTFVSFPAEIIRTSYHMLRYLKQDFKDSPAYAARKVAGLALVSSLAFAAQGVSKALMGMDDDEEEAVREMAPDWSKNSNLMFIGRDDKGNVQYLDMSFLDPYNYFKRPINAILREQPFQDAATQSASEMLTPFFGVDITFGTVAEVWTNRKDSGGKVFNEQDSVAGQVGDIANHLRKNLQPGFANNIERMYKAMTGEKSASGKEYTVPDEMAALVGLRASTVDPKTALYYRSFNFKQSKSDANKMLKDLLREQNDVSLSDLQDARDAMLKAREQTYAKMIRLVKAAKKSGMSLGDIRQVLKLSGVSAKDVMALIQGRIPENDDYTKMARSISRRASILYGAEAGQEVMERARSLRD